MNSVGIYISLILILFVLLLLSFRFSLLLARRAICKVISIFREYDAVQFTKALTLENLGLAPRPLFTLRVLRDYKPWALQTLVQSGIIRAGQEGTFYLSEDTLNANPNIQTACQINKVKI